MSKLLFMLVLSHLTMPLIAYRDDNFFVDPDDYDRNLSNQDDDEDDFEEPFVDESLTQTLTPEVLSSSTSPSTTTTTIKVPRELPKKKQRSAKPTTLMCYSCAYRKGQSLKGCLNPEKYKERILQCHSEDDSCYTTVEGSSPSKLSMLVRGCRSACVTSSSWFCCQGDKCNSQPYQDPEQLEAKKRISRRTQIAGHSAATPTTTPSVAFFVGVLLLLQTVLKVAFV